MFPTKLIPHVIKYLATGSRVICNPPVMDTDEDYVVLVRNLTDFHKVLMADGWEQGSANYGEEQNGPLMVPNSPINQFKAYRKGDINLIVTPQPVLYTRYDFATRIATALNLTKKEDRVTLFTMIRDTPHEVFYAQF